MTWVWLQTIQKIISCFILMSKSQRLVWPIMSSFLFLLGRKLQGNNVMENFVIVWPCIVADSFVNKTNRCTVFQFYWYYYSTCYGQPFCPSSGVLSCTLALVHFMQLWPFAARSRMELRSILLLAANGHNCIKCTKADVQLRTPDDGQKGCPKNVE